MSAIGPKRTSLVALHMSASDPKRTMELAVGRPFPMRFTQLQSHLVG
jgi:hypothetical protein